VGRPHKKMGQKKTKKMVPRVQRLALGEEVLPRVPGIRHSGKRALPRVLGAGSRGRGHLPRVLELTLGEIFCFFVFLPQFFCEAFKHYLKLLAQIWLTFEFFYIFR
jgi:hypothetical protein